MNFKQKNVATVLVAKTVAATADLEGTNITAKKSSLTTGEPVVMSAGGVIADATGTLPKDFKVAVKLASGDIKTSNVINVNAVKKVTVHKYAAGANQVDYIGYNGTTGSIDVIDNNVYKVNIYLRGTTALDFSRMQVKHGVYKSDSAATQEEIAAGLTNSLITNFSREGSKLAENIDVIKFERVHSAAGTAISNDAADTVIGVAGSKYITIADVTDDDDIYLFAVGDYIRIGTGVTDPVYKVTATTVTAAAGGVLTLDIPLQATVDLKGNSAKYITAAQAAAGNFGIKMTGSELPFNEWTKSYDRSTWTFGLQDFGSTLITNSTVMSLGSGYGKAVQELEAWCSMNAGRQYLNATGVVYPTLYASSTGTYALIHIQYQPDYTTELGHKVDQHAELWIACEKGNGGAYSDANTGLGTIIDAYVTAYKWDIAYVGASGTANVINA